MFRLKILSEIEDQNYLRSNQVTKIHQRSNKGQIRSIGVKSARLVEIYQIFMFRLRIWSEIKIQNYLRSDQVIKSHQRSNLKKTCQKRNKSGCLIQLYALNICFDSEFGREFKFRIQIKILLS